MRKLELICLKVSFIEAESHICLGKARSTSAYLYYTSLRQVKLQLQEINDLQNNQDKSNQRDCKVTASHSQRARELFHSFRFCSTENDVFSPCSLHSSPSFQLEAPFSKGNFWRLKWQISSFPLLKSMLQVIVLCCITTENCKNLSWNLDKYKLLKQYKTSCHIK